MKWYITMGMKDYFQDWSNQVINTSYQEVSIAMNIQYKQCCISLDGEANLERVFYLVWELLFLYDGYFYEIQKWEVDGIEKDVKKLYRLPLYKTNKKWMSSELLGRANRDFSPEIIERYDVLRNTGMSEKKMTKSVVNAFYYLHSEAYERINSDHLLSLLLNVADGFVINTYKDMDNVKASLDILFKKTISIEKLKEGISLLGMDGEQYKFNLAQERHMFDHYVYKEDSITTFVYHSNEKIADFITWFFIYVMELVLRINFLRKIGVEISQEVKDYSLDVIKDWIIFENDLDIECTTPYYQGEQLLRKKGIVMR